MLPGNVLPKDLKEKFGGLQPGGFNVAMWDGSVRFIKDTVSDRTLGLLLNPRDGQVIPNDW
jgi:prepilin-type processing-associated H-X9-DG protein